MKLRIGISPCPNDIFAFHALLNDRIDTTGLELEFSLLDIQELNDGLRRGIFDIAKASFHAAIHLDRDYQILRSGAALGSGVGPLLLGVQAEPPSAHSRVLCPGEWTTATLLMRVLYPDVAGIDHCLFSEILPRVAQGEADYGVVIHEGRFTYEQHSLHCIRDLGEEWEERTGELIPLGGLLARRDLCDEALRLFDSLVKESIAYAFQNRDEAFVTMKRHAAELSDDAIWKHVELYVNEMTIELGEKGEGALEALYRLAYQHGVAPRCAVPLISA